MPLHKAGGQGILTDLRQTIFSCLVDGIFHDSAEIMKLPINLVFATEISMGTLCLSLMIEWYWRPRTRIEEVRVVLCRGNFSLSF